jgi:hypothetical protein
MPASTNAATLGDPPKEIHGMPPSPRHRGISSSARRPAAAAAAWGATARDFRARIQTAIAYAATAPIAQIATMNQTGPSREEGWRLFDVHDGRSRRALGWHLRAGRRWSRLPFRRSAVAKGHPERNRRGCAPSDEASPGPPHPISSATTRVHRMQGLAAKLSWLSSRCIVAQLSSSELNLCATISCTGIAARLSCVVSSGSSSAMQHR